MDITTLAAWGEFLGGIAVVVSLIYLAGQIRQNSRLLKNSTAATMGAADIAISSVFLDNPDLMKIYNEGLEDPAALSAVDRQRMYIANDMMARAFNRSHAFAKGSGVEDSIWETEVRSYGYVFRSAGGQEYWKDNRRMFSNEFQSFIDGLIREGEAAG